MRHMAECHLHHRPGKELPRSPGLHHPAERLERRTDRRRRMQNLENCVARAIVEDALVQVLDAGRLIRLRWRAVHDHYAPARPYDAPQLAQELRQSHVWNMAQPEPEEAAVESRRN